MRFYLGCPSPHWLALTSAPLFVSQRRLAKRKSMPRATCRWALDSGGFTELSKFGQWQTTAAAYAAAAIRYQDEIGSLDWAAPQDWMCEPWIVAKTGKTVAEHQRRTVDSLLELRALAPGVAWTPVIQGWTLAEYVACIEAFDRAGIDLRNERVVGIGSVCRRQGTNEAATLVRRISAMGIRLHGFGFKVTGLLKASRYLSSSDSMAWSYAARQLSNAQRPSPVGCSHRSCSSCLKFALAWREALLARVARAESDASKQVQMFPTEEVA